MNTTSPTNLDVCERCGTRHCHDCGHLLPGMGVMRFGSAPYAETHNTGLRRLPGLLCVQCDNQRRAGDPDTMAPCPAWPAITPRTVTAGDWTHAYVDIMWNGQASADYAGIYEDAATAAAAAAGVAARHLAAFERGDVVPGIPQDNDPPADLEPVAYRVTLEQDNSDPARTGEWFANMLDEDGQSIASGVGDDETAALLQMARNLTAYLTTRQDETGDTAPACHAARTGEGYWTCDQLGGCNDCRYLARAAEDVHRLDAWNDDRRAAREETP